MTNADDILENLAEAAKSHGEDSAKWRAAHRMIPAAAIAELERAGLSGAVASEAVRVLWEAGFWA